MTLENTVREAVQHRASGAPAMAPDLATRALAGGQRRARRRASLIAVAGVLSVALVGAVAVEGAEQFRSDPILAAAPSTEFAPGTVSIPAYSVKTAAGEEQWKVVDPATGSYREVPGDVVAVSPDQRYVVLAAKPHLIGHRSAPPQFTVYDTGAGRAVRTLDFPLNTHPPLWSPDGRWLAFPHARNENRADAVTSAMSFLDVTTGRVAKVDIRLEEYEVEQELAWAQDSSGVYFYASRGRAGEAATTVRLARDGALTPVTTRRRPEGGTVAIGVTLTEPRAMISVGNGPRRIGVRAVEIESGDVQSAYDAAERSPDAVGTWLDGAQYAWAAWRSIAVIDLRTGKTRNVLTLPEVAETAFFTHHPRDARTLSFPYA